MKIRVTVSTNKVGSECEDVLEFDDADCKNADGSLNKDFIEEAARDWMWDHIEWNWTAEE